MEIPDLNMISDFEAGMNCLQNPSLISRSFAISGIGNSFWKWGALILAVVATFGSIIRRIKLLFIYIRTVKPSAEPLLQYLTDDFDFSDDDDDELSSDSSEEDDVTRNPSSFSDRVDRDFGVAGSGFSCFREQGRNGNFRNRRRRGSFERFPWADFAAGKSVVKLWDNLSLGYDFDEEVRVWDLNKDLKFPNIFGDSSVVPAMTMGSPAVVLSSEVRENNSNNNDVVLSAYDTRMKGQAPAICASWHAPAAKFLGVNGGGVEKVYVRDNAAGVVTVGDMRNVKTPLGSLTETDGDTWWDADAVIADDE